MNRIVIGPDLRAKLPDLGAEFEVCDEAGQTLGDFVPASDRDRWQYDWAKTQFTDEELEQARQEPGGKTTAEVLNGLGS